MTRSAVRVLTASLLLFFLRAGAAYGQTQLDEIEGKWEGAVSMTGTGSGTVPREIRIDNEFQMRVEIFGDGARVSIIGSQSWELGGGRMAGLGASAIIFGVTGANVDTDNWVISVTKRDQDSLLVFVSRVISGRKGGAEGLDGFAIGGFGELQKVADD